MKALIVLAALLSLGAAAQAKYAPGERPAKILAPDDSAIYVGAAGAMLDKDYVRAPRAWSKSGYVTRCRRPIDSADKTRHTQSCH